MWRTLTMLTMSCVLMLPAWSKDDTSAANSSGAAVKKSRSAKLDRSGKARRGKASYYARRFAGRTMADGTPMKPQENIAASKTLPLGTKAEVVNLENGKSAVVEVRDRGPYVDGRIIDLSPKVASDLDMKEDGVAPVVVKPIELPPEREAKADATASEGGSGTGGAVNSGDGGEKSKAAKK